ncbi:oxidoreductase [Amylibacter kogurei]|uniref:Oxidoreductase n=1 Tax=Paramylibacter kogurei TaxID=1889778 RepID=A0A2G5K5V3_9RHOB|nr:nitronate monooxygenase [Amylibacter kogurei]PIB24084.1 oxidoreductase [Amylibacter kogurei]
MIHTRLTKLLGIQHPIILAPMAMAAGGTLAASVSNAGGLGLIGGGYGDGDWLKTELANAGDAPIGVGFITWALDENPMVLDIALAHKPRAVFLSFGNVAPYVDKIKSTGAVMIAQVQTMADARAAIDAGADIIVAQGSEGGGHGQTRATMSFVPEVADYIAAHSPQTLLCAAGGIADGRGLAAALMLGADGVVIGSRFWASGECLAHQNMQNAAMAADGDQTLRTTVIDITRNKNWPARYNIRVMKNEFSNQWHGAEDALRKDRAAIDQWNAALAAGNPKIANPIVGEAVGIINEIRPTSEIMNDIMAGAETLLAGTPFTQN